MLMQAQVLHSFYDSSLIQMMYHCTMATGCESLLTAWACG